ncbi:nicotinic acid mononucleotide adenyltransferase [Lutibacter holmesii]|uniref:Nicotinic acid mononucleotide adenyltransferase n=1 Tax=Lutibacter holmesii TaxID=1137985 RepID=A0ABW3WRE6_9FLAO
MKNILFIIGLLLLSTTAFSQDSKTPKTEIKGDLTEITLYYDNGEIMQHGFYDKTGELHGGWESYNNDGTRKCVAFYDKGVKVGTWFYWNKGIKTKVIYENNVIKSIEEVTPELGKPTLDDH